MESLYFLILVWFILSWAIGNYAQEKGYSSLGFAALSFFTSPIIGGLIALVITDKRRAEKQPGRIAELAALADLRDRGAITETEFQAQKAKLLPE